jgi:hypothetical protein
MRNLTHCFIMVFLGLVIPSRVTAQVQVVVPNVYTTTEGPGSSSLPIHIQNNPWTFQLILHESQLTSLVGQELTGISYRHSAVMGGGYPLQTTTWTNYVIRLGTSVAPGVAAETFANNFTSPPTQVRDGTFTVAPGAWPNFGPGAPNPWGPEITFDTPYHYSGGNLAMLITHPGSDNPNIGNALIDTTGSSSPGRGTDFSYFAGTGFDSLSGGASNFMPIVRFTAVTPVPEPTTCLMTCTIVMAVGALRRTRRSGVSITVTSNFK